MRAGGQGDTDGTMPSDLAPFISKRSFPALKMIIETSKKERNLSVAGKERKNPEARMHVALNVPH